MKTYLIAIFLGLLLCEVTFAIGDFAEGGGGVAAGGIQFIKNPAIKILSEELTIIPQEVKANYLFKNTSDKPFTTTIYFLLPPHEWRSEGSMSWDEEISDIKNIQELPFRNFSAEVDGQLVNSQIKSRAILEDGKDITDILMKAGIPLNANLVADNVYRPYEEDDARLKKWNTAAKQLGLLDATGKPRWKKQILFSWEQTFPVNKTIMISYRYSPAPEYQREMPINNTNQKTLEFTLDYLTHTASHNKWIDISHYDYFNEYMSWAKDKDSYRYGVEYILTTGENWNDPIEKFTLNLPYLNNNSVIAYNHFYKNNTAKIIKTPEKIQISLSNFVPTKNLNVIFGTTKALESIK